MKTGTSLAVQRLRLCASTAGGTGSIPGRGTKIPHAPQCSQRTKFLMTIMAQVFICSATLNTLQVGFPDGTVVKNLPANARDMGLSPGPGRSHMLRSN